MTPLLARNASPGALSTGLLAEIRAMRTGGVQLSHNYDEASGLIRIKGRGLWTADEVDDHFARVGRTIHLLRRELPFVKSFVDLREAATQPPATSQRMSAAIAHIYQPDDRIALVLASSLLKAQMRRVIPDLPFAAFVSPHAAETWLNAYD